jgi:aminopeptidase N
MSRMPELSLAVKPTNEPVVQRILAEQFEAWDLYYDPGPARDRYRAFARARLAPLFARLGWQPRAEESDNDAVLRGALIDTLGRLGDPAVVAEANRRFQASIADPASLTGSARDAVLNIVATRGDAAAWEQLHQLARASMDGSDRSRLWRRLGASEDPVLAERALALAVSGEPKTTEAPGIIAAVGAVFPDKAYDFALAHRAQVEALIEPTSRVGFFTRLASGSRDPAMVGKLDVFARTAPASTLGEIRKAQSAIRVRAEVIQKRLPELDRWLMGRR